mmetsp:Transcript_36652/g.117708  ORF Transcript_36652/g.117708 Transcript_36652/m.117708 type:complete len:248 (-) Transcript_36652:381-1124(-)|eukprot:scaffold25803_cov129-Isochrysis_galbana.AAC.5
MEGRLSACAESFHTTRAAPTSGPAPFIVAAGPALFVFAAGPTSIAARGKAITGSGGSGQTPRCSPCSRLLSSSTPAAIGAPTLPRPESLPSPPPRPAPLNSRPNLDVWFGLAACSVWLVRRPSMSRSPSILPRSHGTLPCGDSPARSLRLALRSDDSTACATPSPMTPSLDPSASKREPSCRATTCRVAAAAIGCRDELASSRFNSPGWPLSELPGCRPPNRIRRRSSSSVPRKPRSSKPGSPIETA